MLQMLHSNKIWLKAIKSNIPAENDLILKYAYNLFTKDYAFLKQKPLYGSMTSTNKG